MVGDSGVERVNWLPFFYKEFSKSERLVVAKAEDMGSVRGWMLVVGGDKGIWDEIVSLIGCIRAN